MQEFDDIPDENTINLMNGAYDRARVRRETACGGAQNNCLPEHCLQAARECVKRYSRISACLRAFLERSVRAKKSAGELLPMAEELLAEACELAECESEEEDIPLRNAAVCAETLSSSLDGAVMSLCKLIPYSQKTQQLLARTLALAYLSRSLSQRQ